MTKPPKTPRQYNSTLPRRQSRLTAKQPMRKRKRKRSAAETQRIYGGEERIKFVASLPCSVMGCGRGPSENCHATTGGMGRKASAELIFPACRVHHAECHQVGVRTWEALHHLDCLALAAFTERRWQWSRRQPVRVGALVAGVLQRMEEGE